MVSWNITPADPLEGWSLGYPTLSPASSSKRRLCPTAISKIDRRYASPTNIRPEEQNESHLHLPGNPPFTHNENPHFARWGFSGPACARQLGDSAGPRSIAAAHCRPGERRPDGNKERPATRSACGPKSSRQHTYIILAYIHLENAIVDAMAINAF